MNISAIMPIKGRTAETVALIPRLVNTAGIPFQFIAVIDDDPYSEKAVKSLGGDIEVIVNNPRVGYWQSMANGARQATGELIVNLANDLMPGREWLRRAYDAYQHRYGQGLGIIGFNDGIHQGNHAGHFMIHRELLREWYGDVLFPDLYFHLWQDTEIVQRGIELKIFAVAPWSVLYHDHPASGKVGDQVYALGHSKIDQDRATFERRQAAGWK